MTKHDWRFHTTIARVVCDAKPNKAEQTYWGESNTHPLLVVSFSLTEGSVL